MHWKKTLGIAGAAAAISATAYAFPWDIDMVDAAFLRGYEWRMAKTPEGAVSVNNYRDFQDPPKINPKFGVVAQLYGVNEEKYAQEYAVDLDASKADAEKLLSSERMAETGKKMFNVYCTACHGVDGAGGAPVAATEDSKGAAVKRWTGIPSIGGNPGKPGAEKLKCHSDNELYLVIRNGKGSMPRYGHAMYDHEIWALISYVRNDLQQSTDLCQL